MMDDQQPILTNSFLLQQLTTQMAANRQAISDQIHELRMDLKNNYVRKDVLDSKEANFRRIMDDLRRDIDDLKSRHEHIISYIGGVAGIIASLAWILYYFGIMPGIPGR
jgi:hypothetical protein